MPNRLIESAAFDALRLVDMSVAAITDTTPELHRSTGLGTHTPVLLLPVGLSARFATDGMSLRVRIHPDSIHVDNHRYTLTPEERRLGDEFWVAATRDRDAAWHRLVTALGTSPRSVNRAMWVVRSTDPTGAAPPPAEEPSRRCLALPDQWLVLAWHGDTVVAKGLSEPVSPDLPVDAPKESTPLHAWLTEFGVAESLGMGVTLRFDSPTFGVDLLLAVGVRAGSTPEDAADEVERMLAAHRYSDGLEFLAQGTPTNNTPQSRAAWRSAPDPDLCLARELDLPVTVDGSNADRTASALGIDRAGAIRSLSAGDLDEQGHAKAMLQALWPVTGGEFLEVLLADHLFEDARTVPASVEAFARRHATEFVRGRGPLPVLRVGRQPYGMLPITSTHEWAPHPAEPDELRGLQVRLKVLWPFWEAALDRLPRVGKLLDPSAAGAAQVVAELLGQGPVPDPSGYLAYSVIPPYMSSTIDIDLVHNLFAAELSRGLLGTDWFPLVLNAKVAPGRPADVVCPAADADTPARLAELAAIASDYDALKAFPASPTDLTTQLVQRSLMRAMDRNLKRFAIELGDRFVVEEARRAPTFLQSALVGDLDAITTPSIEMLTLADLHVTSLDAAVQVDEGLPLSKLYLRPDLIALLPDHRPAPEHGDAVAGLAVLASLGPDELSLLLGESIDLYANRYDAWCTSLATQRLQTLRAERPEGVHLGGYGWLVNVSARTRVQVTTPPAGVSPEPPLFDLIGDAGVVHAPSVQHAATAAVLRHADLGDRADGLGPGDTESRFNLTSASARRARWLIEAMEAGQPLAALLGYRVERLLQDLGHADLIADVRAACPLVNGEAVDHDANALTIPPHDVVDGLTLWRRLTSDLQGPPLPAGLPAEVSADLVFSIDSVADLLVVEGVHHLVGGDHGRAHATLTGLAWGESPSSDLRSLDEMRDRLSIPCTLAALVAPDVAPVPGWAGTRPRAVVAPAAETYAQRLLPDPATCVLTVERDDTSTVDVTLASLGLCALDVLGDCGGTGERGSLLEARVLAAAGAGATRLSLAPPAPGRVGWPQLQAIARRARNVLAAARPLTRDDLVIEDPKVDPPAPSALAAGSTTAVRSALDAQLATLETAHLALAAALEPVEALEEAGQLTDGRRDSIVAHLTDLEPFGIDGSVPLPGDDLLASARRAARHSGDAAAQRPLLAQVGARTIDGAPTPAGSSDGSVARIAQLARAAFGDATLVAAIVDLPDDAEPVPPPDETELADWVGELAEVRATTRAVHGLWLAAEALGADGPRWQGMQFPRASGESWVGGHTGDRTPWSPPTSARRAVVADRVGGAGSAVHGLVLDSWVEEIPLPDDELTGLAMHINASDARPPQSWLLAVPADPSQPEWRLGDLVTMLKETLELARFRAAEPPSDLPHRQLLPLVYVPDGIEGTRPFREIFTSALSDVAISSLTLAHVKAFGDGN